jgi:hypothetical protein
MKERNSEARDRQYANSETPDCPTASPGKDAAGNCKPIPGAGATPTEGQKEKSPGGGNTDAGALNTGPHAQQGGLARNQ